MKRKMHKFAEGGFETAEGSNKNISDDIRARALRSVAPDDSPAGTSTYGEQNDLPETQTITKTTVSKTIPKSTGPKAETKEEYTTRMEGLTKKQALERVEPEDYVPGPGLLKNIVKRGLKTISGDTFKQLGNQTAKQLENKATKMLPYDKSGSLAARRAERASMRDTDMKRSNAKNYGIDPDAPGSMSALEALRKDIGGGKFSMKKGGKVKTYKAGGSVSSASKRADGCAIRGKTRA